MTKKSNSNPYKVPVQRGPIIANPMTQDQMYHQEKQVERIIQLNDITRMQTLDLKVPKQ